MAIKPRRLLKSFLCSFKCSVSSLIRAEARATCTSTEPTSLPERWYSLMISSFCCLFILFTLNRFRYQTIRGKFRPECNDPVISHANNGKELNIMLKNFFSSQEDIFSFFPSPKESEIDIFFFSPARFAKKFSGRKVSCRLGEVALLSC